ncbi:MFS transporter [Plantactinospora soyae]|uniref:MFS family permease n=1 Tax=Plantactinospora soyae TaxID=1544732 RepID=A0A927R6Z5_9ACTN|nr:MFS transporter [Plantactinospora soyae]MBE1487381.1 MFS family permease [Plantactinospora soyae]
MIGSRASGLLADADFRRWFGSRSISEAGTAASLVALPLLTYQLSDSATMTAAVVGVQAVPYLLFGLFAGAAADRWRRRAMMIGADLGCAVLLSTLLLADLLGVLTSWHVLAVAFGLGCGFCWFDAAAWGSLPRLVGRAKLAEANSLLWSTEIVLSIAMPAVAGLLAALTDPTLVLGLDAASYLVSAALLFRLRAGLDPTIERSDRTRRLGAEIAEGLRYLWRQPMIRALSLAGFGFSLSAGGVFGLLVVHADEVLAVTSTDWRVGLLYAAAAVGSLLAALLLPRFGRSAGQGAVSIIGYGIFVAALVGLAVAPVFAAALLLWTGWEFGRTTANINGITVRQQLTPDELQGRVNTTGRMIAWGGTPFGAIIGGAIAETAGVPVAYLVLTVPAVLGFGVLLASPVRRLRSAVA